MKTTGGIFRYPSGTLVLLQYRLKILPLGQSFNSDDVACAHLHGQELARKHRALIHQHRTRPALSTIAGPFGTGQIELIPEQIKQRGAMFRLHSMGLTIDM